MSPDNAGEIAQPAGQEGLLVDGQDFRLGAMEMRFAKGSAFQRS